MNGKNNRGIDFNQSHPSLPKNTSEQALQPFKE